MPKRLLLALLAGCLLTWHSLAESSRVTLITDMEFSPDGASLAVAGIGPGERFSNPGLLQIHDLSKRTPPLNISGKQRFSSVAYRPDGKILATGSEDGTVVLWSATTGKKQMALAGCKSQVWEVAYSPSGRQVAAASGWSQGLTMLWSVGPGKTEWSSRLPSDPFYSVTFSPDGTLLAAGDRTGTARVWTLLTNEQILELKGHKGWVTEVAFSQDGRYLATLAGSEVRLYDITSGEQVKTLSDPSQQLHSLAWFPDGTRLIAGGINYDESPYRGTARVWEVESGKLAFSLEGHKGVVRVAVSPSGDRIATGDEEGRIRLWGSDGSKAGGL